MRPIILASKSPRRRQLLEKIGLKFKVVESNYEEKIDSKLTPHQLVEKLSLEKAKAVAQKHKNAIIIGADTIVVCNGKIMVKPKDEKDARLILKFLSGKTHLIVTGFTIIDEKSQKIITKSEETEVKMRKISKLEIDSYIKTKEPFDKAGAYAIQGKAKEFIEKIDGDLSNAIGLPVDSLLKELKLLGIK